MARDRKFIGEMLLDSGVITLNQLERALEEKKNSGKKIGEVLIDLNFCTEEQIARVLSEQLNVPLIDPSIIKIPEEVLALVPGQKLREYNMIPFSFGEGGYVKIAMSNPLDLYAIDNFNLITDLKVEPYISTTRQIQVALDKHYGNSEALVAAEEFAKTRKAQIEALNSDEINEDVENSPIVILVRTMIEQAARLRASDIHVEALQNKVRVRYRIDGALYEKASYDIQLMPAIIARLKVIGGMDISEKRKPQDGRITLIVDHQEYDIRASILPTVYGEKCVMRLALKTGLQRDKSELGFSQEEMKKFDHILSNPNGIILVTGPTGSGKSTTLYTALSELNREDVNIITVEDPVEANIDGINQVQTNNKAELTFATALRSILRQDPDIIMIGEIRDHETASIAVQASITGHLVVSTLHTNSSAATITRLEDMGLESYLVADSVKGIIAQRLVRRLCPDCKKPKLATPAEKELMLIRGADAEKDITIYEPCGCPKCNDTGYKGRIGVYEIMEITPALRKIISKNEDTEKLKQEAIKEGMNTLRMAASNLVKQGITTVSEMVRVSFEE